MKTALIRPLVGIAALILSGCNPNSHVFEPKICYTPSYRHVSLLPSPFPTLTKEEKNTDWGKELFIGKKFANENDYYRAITAFKAARFLIPADYEARINEIDYQILLAYYMGKKHKDVIETFHESHLCKVSSDFPAFRELVIVLRDSYYQLGNCEKAEQLLEFIEKGDEETASEIQLSDALLTGNLGIAHSIDPDNQQINAFTHTFCRCKKSVRKAQTLNALLPGAGYYYVGQKKTALTSFVINTCFTAAAYYFFKEGNWGAGAFTTSLEMGWYIGGINGAGLAAKEYNERFYEPCMKEIMEKQRLFPVLMLQTGF